MKRIDFLDLCLSFESLSLEEQIDKLERLLESVGIKPEVLINRGNINCIYKTTSYVFVTIKSADAEGTIRYVIMDRAIYDSVYKKGFNENLNGTTNNMVVLIKRHDGNFKAGVSFNNTILPLHKAALMLAHKYCANLQIDHKTSNPLINTLDMLRSCTAQQNMQNIRGYCQVGNAGRYFSAPNAKVLPANLVKDLITNYRFNVIKGRLVSPQYDTVQDMYKALNQFENAALGEFRYNPLLDCYETFYAFVIDYMIGDLEDVTFMDYNRDFVKRRYPDITQYYML